ncbi:uracil-DNA glycosylase [Balneicella halophila]|uniref:Uracil-DNA glycosylase n=1 Tax=Balneicella halophila TaxID=1537566 RepID=A0A7L4UQS0_BALHA|nr:uracil-DNA glycosylase [Balneicella halophila]PVX52116.1 uracil-DNA glycosylase [Balneicella halophila]
MDVKIAEGWKDLLSEEFEKNYFKNLVAFVKDEYKHHKIYPPGKKIFAAFDFCSLKDLKVVIIGQDPYHGEGQAHGLCFSVANDVRIPPSLQNIFKELNTDVGKPIPTTGNLESWAKQGILMLNATLTVRANSPRSHQNKGWEQFTDAVIEKISEEKEGVVFLLWGAYAQRKGAVIDRTKHLVLESAHPSPFAAHRGFFGNRHFSQTNTYLKSKEKTPIVW